MKTLEFYKILRRFALQNDQICYFFYSLFSFRIPVLRSKKYLSKLLYRLYRKSVFEFFHSAEREELAAVTQAKQRAGLEALSDLFKIYLRAA